MKRKQDFENPQIQRTEYKDHKEHQEQSEYKYKKPQTEHERYGNKELEKEPEYTGPVEKPNFKLSGALARDTNTKNGIVLKYSEPVEARKPALKYRLYVFKQDQQVELFHIHKKSHYLFGKEEDVVDILTQHPSCSRQHCVLQFRQVTQKDPLGIDDKLVVKPYIIDLESANGTFVNDEKIPKRRYYELKIGDVVKVGLSSREYVFMHEELV
jgi:smad nuclear-interacting protein 1